MKTVVMTGATSFLGRNVLKGLANEGYKIYAMVRKNSMSLPLLPQDGNISYVYGDLGDLGRLCGKVGRADIFVHFAWDGSGYAGRADGSVQTKNIAYSMAALDAGRKLGCGVFVFSGSQAEYGHVQGKITENTECSPFSAYGRAKLEFSRQAEGFCRRFGMRFIHLRIFSVYGPGDHDSSLVSACVRGFNGGETLQLGACIQKWNYLYIDDFVDAVKMMLGRDGIDGIYNVAGTETRRLKEFVREIYRLSNQTGRYELGKAPVNPEGSPALWPDISKIKDLLGWEPKWTFSDGVLQIMGRVTGR